MYKLSVGDRVVVVGGLHEGLRGVLRSVNNKGVSFIAVDGVLKAVKTIHVVPVFE